MLKLRTSPWLVATISIILLIQNCNAQGDGGKTDLSVVLQQLQGVMDKLNQLESTFTASQEAMASKMEFILNSTIHGLENEFKSTMTEYVSEFKTALPEMAEPAMARLNNMDISLKRMHQQLVEFKRFLFNANTLDTDCPEEWQSFEGSCYFFSSTKESWLNARQECIGMGGDHVKITTNKEWDFLAGYIKDNTWVGLSDLQEEGRFKWSVDDTLETEWHNTWWHKHQPDNYEGNEDCVHYWFFWGTILWNDANCNHEMLYVCEMSPNDLSA